MVKGKEQVKLIDKFVMLNCVVEKLLKQQTMKRF